MEQKCLNIDESDVSRIYLKPWVGKGSYTSAGSWCPLAISESFSREENLGTCIQVLQ